MANFAERLTSNSGAGYGMRREGVIGPLLSVCGRAVRCLLLLAARIDLF